MIDPKQAVNNGVRLLDEKVPDWKDKINLEILDMSNPYYCILGQLFNGFTNGMSKLGLNDDNVDEYGFEVPDYLHDEEQNSIDRAYNDLYDRWNVWIDADDMMEDE